MNSLIKYLKNDFGWKRDWDATEVLGEGHIFTHAQIKKAMDELKTNDPELHRILGYRWQTTRSRNSIANSLYLDPSTLKRSWNKAMNLIMNFLLNEDVMANLEPIDLINKE